MALAGCQDPKVPKSQSFHGTKVEKPLLNKRRKEEREPKDSASKENQKTQQANWHTSMTQSNCIAFVQADSFKTAAIQYKSKGINIIPKRTQGYPTALMSRTNILLY
jgi:hypothetical protein